jgi:hypothetical protein
MNKFDLLKPGSERSNQLTQLVRDINNREDAIQQLKDRARNSVNEWLTEVICQGNDINKAKAIVPHGQWLDWLKAHCPLISDETARRYMKVAANSTRVLNSGVDSLRQALALCNTSAGEGEQTEPKSSPQWMTWANRAGQMAEKFVPIIDQMPDEAAPKFCEDLNRVYSAAKAKWPERFV